MTVEQYNVFNNDFILFRWFHHTRQVHLKELALAREGKKPMPASEWSRRLQRCGYCKRQMKRLIRQMENIVRSYSPYLQEYRP
jgi:hypothetical protein